MNSLGDNNDAFLLPLFLCKLPSFRLQSPPRDVTQELWGCTASYLPNMYIASRSSFLDDGAVHGINGGSTFI